MECWQNMSLHYKLHIGLQIPNYTRESLTRSIRPGNLHEPDNLMHSNIFLRQILGTDWRSYQVKVGDNQASVSQLWSKKCSAKERGEMVEFWFLIHLAKMFFLPTGNTDITQRYSAKKGKLGLSFLRSFNVTGLYIHTAPISSTKSTVAARPQCIQSTLEDLESLLQSVHSRMESSCDISLGSTSEANTLKAPRG